MAGLVEISDHPTLGLKRKIEWHTFIYSEKEQYVKLFTVCHHYQKDVDKYGNAFNSNAVKDFERILKATNQRLVNPVNGLICELNGETNEYNDAAGNVVPNPIGHFDLFQALIQSPVIILSLIVGTIQQEDAYFHSYD